MSETRHIVYLDFESNGSSVPLECGEIIPQTSGYLDGFILLTDIENVSDQSAPNVKIKEFYVKSKHISHIAKGIVEYDEDDLDDLESEEDDYSYEEPIAIPKKNKKSKPKK